MHAQSQKATPAPAARAEHPQDEALCQQLRDQLAPARAESRPHGNLATTSLSACEQQIRDVRTGDQQHQVTEPKSVTSVGRMSRTIRSCSGSGRHRRVLFCLRDTPSPGGRPPFAARWSPGRPTRCPSSGPIPAPTVRRARAGARSRGLKMSGRQNSAVAGNLSAGRSDSDNRHGLAIERRRRARRRPDEPPNRRRHRPSESTIRLPSPCASPSANERPRAIGTPSRLK